jgi:hypothetical protein
MKSPERVESNKPWACMGRIFDSARAKPEETVSKLMKWSCLNDYLIIGEAFGVRKLACAF